MSELYKRIRPKRLNDVIGQKAAVNACRDMIATKKIPHAILFTGPSGSGKTTLARIMKDELGCKPMDFVEVNSADFKGIDTIREIRKLSVLSPMAGTSRVWIIDECHKMTNDAQNAFLKLLEDPPKHAYFFLATTEPQKLLGTVISRCSEVKLDPVKANVLMDYLADVVDDEKGKVSDDVLLEIVDAAEGSVRKALVILDQVLKAEKEEDQLAAIKTTSLNKDGVRQLCRALLYCDSWNNVRSLVEDLQTEEPESVRYAVLGFARKVIIGKEKKSWDRAFCIIDIFSRNFYDSKHAGLAAACYELSK